MSKPGIEFPEIKPDSKIALDLEIDSIHILETMIIIEDNFNIALDAEEFQKELLNLSYFILLVIL